MERYKAIKSFRIPTVNEDGSLDDENLVTIEEGSLWELSTTVNEGVASIHLDKVDKSGKGYWIELHEDTLGENFIKVS